MDKQEQSFLNLVEQNKQVIYKICFMYASDDETVSDLFQEVTLNLWKAYPTFRGESKPMTWIYRIAVNTCVSWLRTTSKHPQTVSLTLSMTELFADEQERENLRELYTLINRLGKLERALIMLWLDEKSYEEISEILDISVTNVGVRINRIKAKLKAMSNN
ncbi:MAG: sigma-70 family RNA polymerase sigma factor [Bacteroidaceae bacterium]|jgi:RNA polymerase sigma-70 factor (ECF subfamily)|nr:sigma-70 family RNA polymerase sigma factor [Bacteroidaceae bacterium]